MKRKICPSEALDASVSLSGSKYLANRLVILAALAKQKIFLHNVVDNDDINTAIEGLHTLGYHLTRDGDCVYSEPRTTFQPSVEPVDLYTSHSGTFSRFITAVAATQKFPVKIYGSDKMNSRPMQALFESLRQLGVSVNSVNDRLPAIVQGPIQKYRCQMDSSISSQYVSALLLVSPTFNHDFEIELTGKEVSTQYIDMTVDLMRRFGASVTKKGACYRVAKQAGYSGASLTIPPDPVSSSYFMAAAAIAGGKVQLNCFDFDSLQGEAAFYKVLQTMGCNVIRKNSQLIVSKTQPLVAVDLDMSEMPDVVQTLAAVACFAKGTTVMKNIAHLAYKESNRIKDTATELQRLGAQVEWGEDYLAVTGEQPLTGCQLETYDDHRMAMSLSLIGAKVPNVVINDFEVVSKSFPDYFDKLADIGIQSHIV